MERRSKRLRTAPQPKYSIDLDSDDSGADFEDAFEAPKTKRPRKSVTNLNAGGSKSRRMVRRKRGNFQPWPSGCASAALLKNLIPTYEGHLGIYRFKLVDTHTLHTYQEEMKNVQDPDLDQWRLSKGQEKEEREVHAKRCEWWNLRRDVERSNELDTMRDERYEAPTFSIKQKLVDLGFEEEILFLDSKTVRYRYYSELVPFEDHKLVRQPKPLTERIWNNIQCPLTEFMQNARKRRLEEKFNATVGKRGVILSEVLEAYASLQPIHSIIPPLADVAILPAFRTIIEDTPLDEEVTAVHFQDAMVNFPRIVAEWREAKDIELVQLVDKAFDSDTNEPDSDTKATSLTLRHPGTFFECTKCRRIISYPRVLVHQCCFSKAVIPCHDQYIRNLGSRLWTPTIRYCRDLSANARLILRNCDLGDSSTHDEVLEKDIRFECLTCFSPKEGRLLMRWPVVHCDGSDSILVAELNHQEASLAEFEEAMQLDPPSESWQSRSWVCRACKKQVSWFESIKHLKEK
ncbi:hypothetical protein H0H92_012214 [Tricholoma furcatifolium]|nr:hypothetical protein H0H92_012214 [Tricholoma furcatifolium]